MRLQSRRSHLRKSVRKNSRAFRMSDGFGHCAALTFLIFAVSCLAQSPSGTPLQYTRTVWRVSDGLPEETVQAVAESKDGLLWIGTTGGLARFDGAHIALYEPGMAKALSVNSIFCLTLGRDGSLWAGTEGGGLVHLLDKGLRVYSASDG